MRVRLAAVLGAAIGQHPQQRQAVLVEERNDPVVQDVGRVDRVLARVQLAEADGAVGVDEGLLIDAANAFQRADVERILRAQVADVLGLDLAPGQLLFLGSLHGPQLSLCDHGAGLRDVRLESLEALLEALQVVAKPHASNARAGNEDTPLTQLVRCSLLAHGRVFEGEVDDGFLDLGIDPVAQVGLAPTLLHQGIHPARVVGVLGQQLVTAPDAPHAARTDGDSLQVQMLCNAQAALGGVNEAVVEDGLLDLGRHAVRVWPLCAGQAVDQAVGAVCLEVAADLVELLPAV